MTKFSLNAIISSAALAMALVSPAAASTITAYVGGVSVANEGMESAWTGATAVTFDGLTSLPAGFSSVGTTPANPIVSGSVNNIYAAPAGDTSNFLTTGKNGTITDTLAAGTMYLGFYWGSVDNYNTLTLNLSDGTSDSITGDMINGVTADGAHSYFVNFVSTGAYIDSAVFTSGDFSFELDNVTSATPEPASLAMLAGGLLAVAGLVRRRKA